MDPLSILLFIVLFGLSAFFSGSEIAFMSLPDHKVDSLVKEKKFWAKALRKLKDNTEKLLITILIGNNLVNVLTASLATKISLDIAVASGAEQSLAIWISTWVITLLLLLFGEIFPKTFATKSAASVSLKVSKIYILLQYILFPIVWTIEKLMKLLNRWGKTVDMTDKEIEAFIDMGKESGVLEETEHEKIKKMLDFHDTTAEEIMTPRIKIDFVSDEETVKDAIIKLSQFPHSRIPVYHENIDKVNYTIMLRDLLKLDQEGLGLKKLKEVSLNNVLKVPLTKPIHMVLELFRKTHKHIAIVIDEYGGVAGLITLEDIVEEVFGEIQDETDDEKHPIVKNGKWYILQSDVRLEELLDQLELEFDQVWISKDEFGGETLSYFIPSQLDRFPNEGDEVCLNIEDEDSKIPKRLCLRVVSMSNNVVEEIEAEII